jgi:ATP-dependent protease ClpP protease subunit
MSRISNILALGIITLISGLLIMLIAIAIRNNPQNGAEGFTAKIYPIKDDKGTVKEIVLDNKNTYLMLSEITTETASSFIRELEASKSKDLYIYIKSPGGSVLDGIRIIAAIQGSSKNITCIADIAISMATAIFQACPTRVVTLSSIIMQHQASFGISHMQVENLKSYYKFSLDVITFIQQIQAERQHMSLEDFQEITDHDWWLFGVNAFKTNSADYLGNITCSQDLIVQTFDLTMSTPFGALQVTFSKCPLIEAPIQLRVNGEVIKQSNSRIDDFIIEQNLRNKVIKQSGLL